MILLLKIWKEYDKVIKSTAFWSVFLFTSLLFAMLVHIAVVNTSDTYVNATIQLARIDFNESLEKEEIQRILGKVKNTQGVKSLYYNPNTCIMTGMFDNRFLTSQSLYEEVQKYSVKESKLFIPDPELLENSCPITGKNSLAFKFSHWIKNIIQS